MTSFHIREFRNFFRKPTFYERVGRIPEELENIGALTDTGEDLKLVHRRIWPKCPRNFLFFFSDGSKARTPSDECDSAPSRKYTGKFVPFLPVSVKDPFCQSPNIFQKRQIFKTLRIYFKIKISLNIISLFYLFTKRLKSV